eukprot:TRINITY_DN4465_c0_g1_i1.p1 TRINITY_DN4465_c0_g1~~TRINITY_DN4465_c0_g1_i1.p1  ORF type:complete len:350 (+),score=41.07 TRINITY_DN4465_c0_g1_i1:76-1125(+)
MSNCQTVVWDCVAAGAAGRLLAAAGAVQPPPASRCSKGGGSELAVYVRFGEHVQHVVVDSEATVGRLRNALQCQVAPHHVGRLSFAGQQLHESELLADAGVGQEAVVDAEYGTPLNFVEAVNTHDGGLTHRVETLALPGRALYGFRVSGGSTSVCTWNPWLHIGARAGSRPAGLGHTTPGGENFINLLESEEAAKYGLPGGTILLYLRFTVGNGMLPRSTYSYVLRCVDAWQQAVMEMKSVALGKAGLQERAMDLDDCELETPNVTLSFIRQPPELSTTVLPEDTLESAFTQILSSVCPQLAPKSMFEFELMPPVGSIAGVRRLKASELCKSVACPEFGPALVRWHLRR